MQYLYRFKNQDNEIIYVGITDNLQRRMLQHFGADGHLPKECYDSVETIEYATFENRDDVELAEKYFISKLKPKFNTVMKKKEIAMSLFELDTKNWVCFELNNEHHSDSSTRTIDYQCLINEYNNKIIEKNGEVNALRDLYTSISPPNEQIKESLDNRWVELNNLKKMRTELIQDKIVCSIGLNGYRQLPKWRKILFEEFEFMTDEQIINAKIAKEIDNISSRQVKYFEKYGYIDKHEVMFEIAEIFRIWSYQKDESWLNIFGDKIEFGCMYSIVLKIYAEKYINNILREIIIHIERITGKSLIEKQMLIDRNLSLSNDSIIVESLIIGYQAA